MVSVKGYIQNKKRYGDHYTKYRSFLVEFDNFNIKEKEEYQLKMLIEFFIYANENSKFYRELYKGIDLRSIKSIADLKKLPVVDKELLRTKMSDVVTIDKKGNVVDHTGGTTGKSLIVLTTPNDMMERMATLDHFKSRVGFEHLKMTRATFNGKHIVPPRQKKKVFWRYNIACKQTIFSSFHLSENNLVYYVNELNRLKPDSIDGFFTSICDVASYIERKKIKLEFFPKAIFPTSETLTSDGRNLLERVFKCKVYNQYASSEGAPFITECSSGELHVEMATGIFENISNLSSEVLVTSFTTHGTPLIRYNIGDSMVFKNVKECCACGLESITVEEIYGRKLDYLYKLDGAKINSGNISNIFKIIPNAIIHAQVVQERIGEVFIKIHVDEDKYKPSYDDLLKNEFIGKFGYGTSVFIKHVDEITREKSGKYMLVKNLVKVVGE
jgi:phenylacetate-CoA ligase